MNKNKIPILILLSIFCLAILIGSVSANENVTDVVSAEQDIDEGLQTNDLNELKCTESDSESMASTIDETSSDDENILSSSSSENSSNYTIKKTTSTEVCLAKPIDEKSYYVLDSISASPNSNTKIIIKIGAYMGDGYCGDVTLKFNGNSYIAEVINGTATIIAKTPSKSGSYKATLSYSGHTYVFGSSGYKYNPSSSTFTLNVKGSTSTSSTTVKTTVKAPAVTAYYKANKYLKVTVKKNGKVVKNLKLKVKVYTGKKYKTYTIKTNKNGVAKLSTKKFKIGSHKVVINSGNKKYKVSKTSKIVIKKKISYTTLKSSSGYKWKIKTNTWNKMKKQAISNDKFFRSVGSGMPGYSDTSVTVKVTKNGYTYTGTAYAIKGSRGVGCEVRGVKTGLRISTLGDYYV